MLRFFFSFGAGFSHLPWDQLNTDLFSFKLIQRSSITCCFPFESWIAKFTQAGADNGPYPRVAMYYKAALSGLPAGAGG